MELKDKYKLYYYDNGYMLQCKGIMDYDLITIKYKYPIIGTKDYTEKLTYSIDDMLEYYPDFNDVLKEKRLENKYNGFRCLYPNYDDMKNILISYGLDNYIQFETYKAKIIYILLPNKNPYETLYIYEIFTEEILHEGESMESLSYYDVMNISPDIIVNDPKNCFLCF